MHTHTDLFYQLNFAASITSMLLSFYTQLHNQQQAVTDEQFTVVDAHRLFLYFTRDESFQHLTGDSADAVPCDRAPLVLGSCHSRLHSDVVTNLY